MKHDFPYAEFEAIEIPDKNISGVYTLPTSSIAVDEVELIRTALANPIGGGGLREKVSAGMKITIAVDDSTRSTKTELMLPLVLAALKQAGVCKEDITVFIALGTHRKMRLKEMEEKYTVDAVKNYRFVNPDWKDTSAYRQIDNSQGFVIKIHKTILDADFVIGLGQTLPHLIAGFGGGLQDN